MSKEDKGIIITIQARNYELLLARPVPPMSGILNQASGVTSSSHVGMNTILEKDLLLPSQNCKFESLSMHFKSVVPVFARLALTHCIAVLRSGDG